MKPDFIELPHLMQLSSIAVNKVSPASAPTSNAIANAAMVPVTVTGPIVKAASSTSNLNTALVVIGVALTVGCTVMVIYYVTKPKTTKDGSDKK
jgi:hypothetical protein